MPLTDIFAIVMSAPLLISALSALVLKERVTFRRWVAILIGFAAVLMMTFPMVASAGMNTPFVVDSSADLPHEDIDPAGGNECVAVGGGSYPPSAVRLARRRGVDLRQPPL